MRHCLADPLETDPCPMFMFVDSRALNTKLFTQLAYAKAVFDSLGAPTSNQWMEGPCSI